MKTQELKAKIYDLIVQRELIQVEIQKTQQALNEAQAETQPTEVTENMV